MSRQQTMAFFILLWWKPWINLHLQQKTLLFFCNGRYRPRLSYADWSNQRTGQDVRGHKVSHYPGRHPSLFILHQRNTAAEHTHVHSHPTAAELLQRLLQGKVLHSDKCHMGTGKKFNLIHNDTIKNVIINNNNQFHAKIIFKHWSWRMQHLQWVTGLC